MALAAAEDVAYPVGMPAAQMARDDDIGQGLAHDGVARQAEGLFGGRIELDDAAFGIAGDDAVER